MKFIDRKVLDVRVFVPAKDFALSKKFYTALGWTVKWDDGTLAVMELADHRFYLQDYYNRKWAENFRFHITVESAQDWYEHVSRVLELGRFGSARVSPPKQQDYGALVTYVWDPSGILLDFAEWTKARPSADDSD